MSKLLIALCVIPLAVGCVGGVTPAQQAQFDRIKCEVKALTPVAVEDADHIVHSIEDGNISLSDVFELIPVVQDTEAKVRAAFAACRNPQPVAVKSPPPAYGDKVL